MLAPGQTCRDCDPSERTQLGNGRHGVFERERAERLALLVCPGNGRDPCGWPVMDAGDLCDTCREDRACVTELGGGIVAPEDREVVDALFRIEPGG